MTDKQAWLSVAGTILFTLAGQLLIKWRVGNVALPAEPLRKIGAVLLLLTDLWVLVAMGCAFMASLFWMSAMTRLPLSIAYPFTSLTFVIVTLLGAAFMQEPITASKVAGILLVAMGLTVLARG